MQEKLEKLIDKHMGKLGAAYPIHHASNTKSSHEPLGAAKVSLSSFSAPDLWMKSGRYRDDNPEVCDMASSCGGSTSYSSSNPPSCSYFSCKIERAYDSFSLPPTRKKLQRLSMAWSIHTNNFHYYFIKSVCLGPRGLSGISVSGH